MSGSMTEAHEPAQLGGHNDDEVRTESWAVVEAGRGVWTRGVVRRRELGSELAGGGGGRDKD